MKKSLFIVWYWLCCSVSSIHVPVRNQLTESSGMKKEVSADSGRIHQSPDYAGLRAFWWGLNSNVTEDCITKDLEAMKENGYGGAIIFDAGSSNYAVAHKTETGPAFWATGGWNFTDMQSWSEPAGLELTIKSRADESGRPFSHTWKCDEEDHLERDRYHRSW